MEHLDNNTLEITEEAADHADSVDLPETHEEIVEFIQDSTDLKPQNLKMDPVKWKHLVRSVIRGRNIMFTGHSGCGKTMAAMSAVRALGREFYYFNLGSTQDPRTTLIGTRQAKEGSTYFSPSLFVKAIQQENAVILLDEISRAHPEATNILLTVLDPKQRYLRLDEDESNETIKVADGVTFMATANIGNEYTATRTMDRALVDRFTTIEMDLLGEEKESELIREMYPKLTDEIAEKLARIAVQTRDEVQSSTPKIDTIISTRQNLEVASLVHDGFSLEEAAEVGYYPHFSQEGGVDSPRSFVKKVVQREIDDRSSDELFSDRDIEAARTRSR